MPSNCLQLPCDALSLSASHLAGYPVKHHHHIHFALRHSMDYLELCFFALHEGIFPKHPTKKVKLLMYRSAYIVVNKNFVQVEHPITLELAETAFELSRLLFNEPFSSRSFPSCSC